MEKLNFYSIKTFIKKLSLALGLYRPARYVNDLLTRREYIRRFRHDIEFFGELLPSESLCFDVGSNIGEKSEALLKAGMRVIAIEPQPLCVAEITARCASYDKIEILQTAIGAEEGEAEMFISDIFHASSSLDKQWGPSHKSIKVPVTTLDRLIEEYGQPYYCKIDVEGYELEVLKGLSHSVPIISLEYHLTDQEIQKAFKCLRYLQDLSKDGIELNLTPAENNNLTFPEWLSLESFTGRFPVEFHNKKEFNYGDIWVRTC